MLPCIRSVLTGIRKIFRRLWQDLHHPNEDSFYECVIPLLRLLQVIGLFPIKRSSPGLDVDRDTVSQPTRYSEDPQFRLMRNNFGSTTGSLQFKTDKLYLVIALVGYLSMAILSGLILVHVYAYAYLLTENFLIKLEAYVACTIMLTTVELPFTYLIEARQFGTMFRLWYKFQRHFKRETATFIDLRIVKLYTILHVAFFLFVFVQLLLQTPSYIPDYFILRLAYSYPYIQVMLAYIVSHVSLKAASIASSEYNIHFQKAVEQGQPEKLERYRLLYIELSNLMRETGNLYHNTTTLDNFVVIVVGLVLHLYRLILVFPRRARQAEAQKFALEVFLVLYRHMYFLLVLYDHGEAITRQCTEEVQKKVNLFRPLKNRKRFYFTERVFFHSLIIFKPVLTVNGYFKLKRSTFTSMMAMAFTFLVVLIQIKRRIGPEQLVNDVGDHKFSIMLQG